MKKYEIVLVLDSDLEKDQLNSEVSKVEDIIKSHQGEVELRDDWGKRELSYKINKKSYGYYFLLVFSASEQVVAEIERALSINENFLRHLCVKKDKHAPDLAPHVKEQTLEAMKEAQEAKVAEAAVQQ